MDRIARSYHADLRTLLPGPPPPAVHIPRKLLQEEHHVLAGLQGCIARRHADSIGDGGKNSDLRRVWSVDEGREEGPDLLAFLKEVLRSQPGRIPLPSHPPDTSLFDGPGKRAHVGAIQVVQVRRKGEVLPLTDEWIRHNPSQ
jgi:hypothetical protein